MDTMCGVQYMLEVALGRDGHGCSLTRAKDAPPVDRRKRELTYVLRLALPVAATITTRGLAVSPPPPPRLGLQKFLRLQPTACQNTRAAVPAQRPWSSYFPRCHAIDARQGPAVKLVSPTHMP